MDVLTLLRSKNKCLQKFLELSLEFYHQSHSNEAPDLSVFEKKRDSILKAIDLFERKSAQAAANLDFSRKTPELIAAVRVIVAEGERLIHEISKADEKIFIKIDELRNQLVQDLASSRKSKSILSKFKSGMAAQSGEELDQTL